MAQWNRKVVQSRTLKQADKARIFDVSA